MTTFIPGTIVKNSDYAILVTDAQTVDFCHTDVFSGVVIWENKNNPYTLIGQVGHHSNAWAVNKFKETDIDIQAFMDNDTLEAETTEPQKTPTLAAVTSRYHFDQEVWFLNGRHTLSGKIKAISGTATKTLESDIELSVLCTSGDIEATFTVDEKDCFPTRQELVKTIIGDE